MSYTEIENALMGANCLEVLSIIRDGVEWMRAEVYESGEVRLTPYDPGYLKDALISWVEILEEEEGDG